MAFTMNIQAQLPAAATRARHSASRRASAVVRAEGETSSPKEAATVYFTNRAGQRVTATDEEVRQHSDGGTRAGCLQGRARSDACGAHNHAATPGWCPPGLPQHACRRDAPRVAPTAARGFIAAQPRVFGCRVERPGVWEGVSTLLVA
jgi:hypothetical protein